MNKKILVVYHSADLDGICSREVAKHFLKDEADYVGWDYGQPLPDPSSYAQVYLIDISFPPEVMANYPKTLVWIDHHKSAIEQNKNSLISGYRVDGVAACRLAWQFFSTGELPLKDDYIHHRVAEPYAVRLLGEYDVWDKRDSNTDVFQLGIQATKEVDWECLLSIPNFESDIERSLYNAYIESILETGRGVQSYLDLMSAQISTERGFDVMFEGLTFRVLNIARCNSMTFTAALKPHHDGCLAYFFNGKRWRFSLYHAPGKEHHDLSQIAVKYGGGGHRGACGFELDAQQLPSVLGG